MDIVSFFEYRNIGDVWLNDESITHINDDEGCVGPDACEYYIVKTANHFLWFAFMFQFQVYLLMNKEAKGYRHKVAYDAAKEVKQLICELISLFDVFILFLAVSWLCFQHNLCLTFQLIRAHTTILIYAEIMLTNLDADKSLRRAVLKLISFDFDHFTYKELPQPHVKDKNVVLFGVRFVALYTLAIFDAMLRQW
ncbi:hypothetical protein ACJX0J_031089, partial [Zea mays]